ncbi:hypothetical protein SELMODRAFT_404137 [Selaginella moellendorffii]|uniref:Uncharacterized protein n=1 Tax=Selaginella moellendorffii TaxID=88036 RepID=D8QUE0_SELML|nr:hypothetical protein SELMODRAFT_404137 [Selaginella moellendorffii]
MDNACGSLLLAPRVRRAVYAAAHRTLDFLASFDDGATLSEMVPSNQRGGTPETLELLAHEERASQLEDQPCNSSCDRVFFDLQSTLGFSGQLFRLPFVLCAILRALLVEHAPHT